MAASTYFAQIQNLYIAYFGRPADPTGLNFWASKVDAANGSVDAVIAGFSASTESAALFGNKSSVDKVIAIYQNAFGRAPEPAGLAFWVQKLDSGEVTQAQASYTIQQNAGAGDKDAVANKLAAAQAFTAQLDTTAEIQGYQGATAAESARAFLTTVSQDPATATAAVAGAAAAVATATAGGAVGTTFQLTTGLDSVVGTSDNDTIVATVSGTDALNTSNALDSINGGTGKDTLQINADATAINNAALPSLVSVEVIEAKGAANVDLDTSAIAGVTNLNILKAGSVVTAKAGASTDILVSNQDGGAGVTVNGGKDVTVKLTNATSDVIVGATAAAAGAVVVENTGAAAMGDITVTGGTTISATQKTTGATVAAVQGNVVVTGSAATTTVTVKQDAAVDAVVAKAAVAAKAEVASVKFGGMASGETLIIGGLTFSASKDLTAAEVAATFANLTSDFGPVALTGDTQGSGVAANGTYSGAFTGWTTGAASGDTVVFTSTVAGNVLANLTASGSAAATTITTVDGVAAVTGVAAKLGVAVGTFAVTDAAASIKTITVDGYSTGTTTATSALETLTLKNGGNVTIADTADTLTLNLEKISAASDLTFTAAPKTLNVNTIGDNHAHLQAEATETLNVSGTGSLQTESMSNAGSLKTVTVAGAAGLTLAANQSVTLTSVNTTATTGAVSASINGAQATYTGGAGKDTVTLATGTALTKAIDLGAGDDTLVFGSTVTGSTALLSGGAGTDTLSMTTDNAASLSLTAQTFYTGFERLTINNSAVAATVNLANLGFVDYVTTTGSTGTLTLNNLANNGTVVLTNPGGVTVGVKDAATGTADVLNAVLASSGNLAVGTLTAANVETINISTVDTQTAPQTKNVDTLTLTADKATTVNVTGSADLTLTLTGSTKVTSIDASTATGGLTVTSLNQTSATTIKGGSGNDVLTAATGSTADVLIGGAGNDTLTGNIGLTTMTGGTGNDLFVIGNVASQNVNTYATITDFQAGDLLKMTGADSFTSAKVVLAPTAVFQDYANAAINALGANDAGWFQFAGDTYVVQDVADTTAFVNGSDLIVKLSGLIDLSNASFNSASQTIALV